MTAYDLRISDWDSDVSSSSPYDFYAADPAIMKVLIGVENQLAKGTLDILLKELVRLRASQINGCAFCLDMHVTDAVKAGETQRRLATVAAWREAPFFSDRERAALEWPESLTLISQNHEIGRTHV